VRGYTNFTSQNLLHSTLLIITAKHGQSPIDLSRLLRIPGDNKGSGGASPADMLGTDVAQTIKDDVSLILFLLLR